jgi:hypothetical protein
LIKTIDKQIERLNLIEAKTLDAKSVESKIKPQRKVKESP